MKRLGNPGPNRRKSSNLHYQTFSVRPPVSRGRPPSSSPSDSALDGSHTPHRRGSQSPKGPEISPLPIRQLAMLAVIALAEQTAFNSVGPYLPEMASTFPEVEISKVGLYVGVIASSFALAQFTTNFFWGWLSDHIGRKPVILISTVLTAACFVAFGFCRTLWQAVVVQMCMGAVNGNQGIVSTCLGEITDRTNQSKAFLYLPVVYGLGAITGPAVGGLMVSKQVDPPATYPYLPPNLLSAGILLVDLVLTMIFLEESLEGAKEMASLSQGVGSLFGWLWKFTSSARKRYVQVHRVDEEAASLTNDVPETECQRSMPRLLPQSTGKLATRDVLNRDTVLLLSSYLLFQFSSISFNSLYPIFAQAPVPSGRNLSPTEIGLSLSFAGLITIAFQVGIFGKLRDRMGNKATYRWAFAGFTLAFLLMPWVGYKDKQPAAGLGKGKKWLWFELCAVLLIKTVSTVGGLTSALLLITNSAPNHSVLGTLNGLAQAFSAAGRAVGPLLSGGLFSLTTHIQPKGEALAWGVFGGVSCIGFCISCGIKSSSLEAAGWEEEEEEGEDEHASHNNSQQHNCQEQPDGDATEDDPLLGHTRLAEQQPASNA